MWGGMDRGGSITRVESSNSLLLTCRYMEQVENEFGWNSLVHLIRLFYCI